MHSWIFRHRAQLSRLVRRRETSPLAVLPKVVDDPRSRGVLYVVELTPTAPHRDGDQRAAA